MADALQAPISSILGYSDLMNRSDGLEADHMGRFLKRIDANLARMQVMLGNLAAIGELDAAAGPAPQRVDLARVVRDATARARPQLDEKALALQVTVDDDLPPALAEPQAVERIVDNLMVNAVMRSPQGADLRLTLRPADSEGGESFLVLSLCDRGRGSRGAPGTVYEVDDADASPVAMRLVRLLAARQGGRAWAESVAGGETFHVRLRAAGGAEGAAG
jgi:signal transduction histidine kinase